MTASPRAALLADSVLLSKTLLTRYLAGFNDATHVRQTPDLPNHLAWTLGHLALTMHRAADRIREVPLPTKDFCVPPEADGYRGSRERGVFDSEAVAFGSRPEERHDRYPTLARCQEILSAAFDRLADAVRGLDDAALERPVGWGVGGQTMPLWALVMRMVFHNGFHTGQVADLRRALGFKSVFA